MSDKRAAFACAWIVQQRDVVCMQSLFVMGDERGEWVRVNQRANALKIVFPEVRWQVRHVVFHSLSQGAGEHHYGDILAFSREVFHNPVRLNRRMEVGFNHIASSGFELMPMWPPEAVGA
jgi:hypothetical protein